MAKNSVADGRREMRMASEEVANLLRQIAADVERLGQLASSNEAIGEDELCEIANVYLALTSAVGPIAGGSEVVSRLLRESSKN